MDARSEPPDLYAILGVARDADVEAIRAAYRNAAKTAHPDLGGSAEEFAALKDAYDCLSDEGRRAHYDRTGDARARPADALDAKALDKLRATIAKVVNLIGKTAEAKAARPEAEQLAMLGDGTLIEALQWQLNKELAEDRERLKGFRTEAAKYGVLAELFEAKAGKPNRISPLMQVTVRYFEDHAAAVAQDIKVKERALEILGEHHFKTRTAIGGGR